MAIISDHLSKYSYIDGFLPSQTDLKLFDYLSMIQLDCCHIIRWKNHIEFLKREGHIFKDSEKSEISKLVFDSIQPSQVWYLFGTSCSSFCCTQAWLFNIN